MSARPSDPDPVALLVAGLAGGPGAITAEEERAYAARIAAGGEDGRAARDALILRNLTLVPWVARRALRLPVYRGRSLADLVGEGCVGLIEAAASYRSGGGRRFGPFAACVIRRALRNSIGSDRLVRVPAPLVKGLHAGRLPACYRTIKDRAKAEACLEAARRALAAGVEYDPPGMSPAGRWGDSPGTSDPAVLAARADELARLRERVARLREVDGRLARVLERRYGLDGGDPGTYEAIGRELGHSHNYVMKLERKALAALRETYGRTQRKGA